MTQDQTKIHAIIEQARENIQIAEQARENPAYQSPSTLKVIDTYIAAMKSSIQKLENHPELAGQLSVVMIHGTEMLSLVLGLDRGLFSKVEIEQGLENFRQAKKGYSDAAQEEANAAAIAENNVFCKFVSDSLRDTHPDVSVVAKRLSILGRRLEQFEQKDTQEYKDVFLQYRELGTIFRQLVKTNLTKKDFELLDNEFQKYKTQAPRQSSRVVMQAQLDFVLFLKSKTEGQSRDLDAAFSSHIGILESALKSTENEATGLEVAFQEVKVNRSAQNFIELLTLVIGVGEYYRLQREYRHKQTQEKINPKKEQEMTQQPETPAVRTLEQARALLPGGALYVSARLEVLEVFLKKPLGRFDYAYRTYHALQPLQTLYGQAIKNQDCFSSQSISNAVYYIYQQLEDQVKVSGPEVVAQFIEAVMLVVGKHNQQSEKAATERLEQGLIQVMDKIKQETPRKKGHGRNYLLDHLYTQLAGSLEDLRKQKKSYAQLADETSQLFAGVNWIFNNTPKD